MALKSVGSAVALIAAGTTQTTLASPHAVSPVSGTPLNIVSKTLGAGFYLVFGVVDFSVSGATVTALTCGVSEKSATFVGQPGDGIIGPDPQGNLAGINLTSGITTVQCTTIVSLTAITTIYLIAQATYTGAGITAYGTLSTALL